VRFFGEINFTIITLTPDRTCLTVGQLVNGWDELPDVTEDEEPHDGDGDSRQPEKNTFFCFFVCRVRTYICGILQLCMLLQPMLGCSVIFYCLQLAQTSWLRTILNFAPNVKYGHLYVAFCNYVCCYNLSWVVQLHFIAYILRIQAG
jgi:hypothetical protein